MPNGRVILFFTLAFVLFLSAEEEKIGDKSDGSRSTPIHIIKLIDQDSSVIWLDENPLMPFSTEKTCAPCHDYKKISSGWHFNVGDWGVVSGRPGQPWIYCDPYSATQIPISLREWPGSFLPEQIGMNTFDYIATFGRHLPGGGVGEREETQSLDMHWRWQVSGKFEINCLSCHDVERAHNQAEHSAQILRQNFRWAATASSGFASVKGTAKNLPDNYDIYAGSAPDDPQKVVPKVNYQEHRFNEKSEVFFDLTRKISSDRCYYCHSTKLINAELSESWHYEEDVHLKAGMNCVDCHRHGIDHNMVRGYDGEAKAANNPMVSYLTCEGCHLGTDTESLRPNNGRLGAPKPEHPGIPPIHFEKLSCSTCHSGSWPAENSINVKTSMTHGLGIHNVNKMDQALPHIISPVFIKQSNGTIAPHNLIWPSYWAEMKGDTIQPLHLDTFIPIARNIIGHIDSLGTGDWPAFADSNLVKILDSLNTSGLVENTSVYVSGGKIYYLDGQNNLSSKEDEAGKPYTWPIAHDVRPAAQSLGIRGCSDCHSTDSPMYFGNIEVDSPIQYLTKDNQNMAHYLDKNTAAAWVFSFTFLFRPWLKYLIIFSCFIIFSVVILYGFRGLSKIIDTISAEGLNQEKGKID